MPDNVKCALCKLVYVNPPVFKCPTLGINLSKIEIGNPRYCSSYEEKYTTLGDNQRVVQERTITNDAERVSVFSGRMLEKWQKGRSQYGTEIKIDPIDEAQMECIDIGNYVMELYFRLETLRSKIKGISEN